MKALFTLILVGLALAASAQFNYMVKLKNGSELRGKLIEVNEQVTKIQTKDGSIWAFDKDEIASIERFQPKVSGKGIYVRAESGLLGGIDVSPSVHIINGYSFNEHWDLGLGLGWEPVMWDHYLPITVAGRYNLLNKPFTPFVDVAAGYQMPFTGFNNDRGGFTSGAKIGITRYMGNRFAFSTSIGYRFMIMKELNWWWDDFVTLREIHRFEIKFGLTFK